MNFPKVSIIVPVYNVEKYLPQCLDSLINQTLTDIEIICIDDCSTDSSLNILRKYANSDNRIKIFENKKNIGAGACRNVGIKKALGKYIGFVDSDDWVNKEYFYNLYTVAQNADVCLTTTVYNVYEKKRKQQKYMGNVIDVNNVSIEDRVNMLVASAVSWTKIYKKSFVEKNHLYYTETRNRGEDLMFVALSLLKTNKVMVNNSAVYYYRQHNESSTYKKIMLDNTIEIFKNYDSIIDLIVKDKRVSDYKKYMFIAGLKYRKYNDYVSCYNNASDTDKKLLQKYYDTEFFNNVIVSLTSYPARIKTVGQTITTLLNQSYKPDKIILWLATSQFPNKEKDLPKKLLTLCKNGLTILWYNRNIKSYTKLVPTYKKFPNSIIVTADDDVLYDRNWLKLLLDSYVRYPFDINCHRCHQITFEHRNKIEKYNNWNFEYSVPSVSFNNFLTGVGGVLYPPYCLYKDVCNEKKFMKLAPMADDVWFWAMAVLNGVKCRVIENCISRVNLSNASQDFALCKINTQDQCLNDKQIDNVLSEYPQILNKLKYVKQRKRLIHIVKKYFNLHFQHGRISWLILFGVVFIDKKVQG